jgi:hypothetical protein
MRGLIHTYVAYCEQKCWFVIEIVCENMQIQEVQWCFLTSFLITNWMVRASAESQWPEVSVNPKENRLFRTDGSYLLALLYSWPVWYQPNHRVLTKGVWQPLRIVELNPKVTNNVWIPPWASHCWKSMCVGSRSRCSVEWHHDRWKKKWVEQF